MLRRFKPNVQNPQEHSVKLYAAKKGKPKVKYTMLMLKQTVQC